MERARERVLHNKIKIDYKNCIALRLDLSPEFQSFEPKKMLTLNLKFCPLPRRGVIFYPWSFRIHLRVVVTVRQVGLKAQQRLSLTTILKPKSRDLILNHDFFVSISPHLGNPELPTCRIATQPQSELNIIIKSFSYFQLFLIPRAD